MHIQVSANRIRSLQFQTIIVPFFYDPETKQIVLPPAFLEAVPFFGEDCVKNLETKIKEQTIYQNYYWVSLPNRPPILLFQDTGKNPLQKTLHDAINVVYDKNLFNIAVFLFRHNFGIYGLNDAIIAKATLEECRQSMLRPDITLHLLFSSTDQELYNMFKTCPYVQEECAPNFES